MTNPIRWPGAALTFSFVLALAAGCGPNSNPSKSLSTQANRPPEEEMEAARQILVSATDATSCGLALHHINSHLNSHPDLGPAPPGPEIRHLLEKRFGLKPEELAEVDRPAFTTLDAQHLGLCFLLREAIRSLEIDRLSPSEKAACCFAWVTRQVVLQDSVKDDELVPPEYVLRRGTGNSWERAEVFLAVLQQLGIPGCLLSLPHGGRSWACGALIEEPGRKEKQILLFDPHLGLPFPGASVKAETDLTRAFRLALPVPGPKDGREIATLAAVRQKPELLAQLKGEEKPLDAAAIEQVRQTRVELVVPLSALSPRMQWLEEFLFPMTGVRPAANPVHLLETFGSAAGVDGGADSVQIRRGSAGLLRHFLSEEEGGVDKQHRKDLFLLGLVPRNSLPPQIRDLEGDPKARMLDMQLNGFVRFLIKPPNSRDLILRGKLREASEGLTQTLDRVRAMKNQYPPSPEVLEDFDRWKAGVYEAYGALDRAQQALRRGGPQSDVDNARAQIEATWNLYQASLIILIQGACADSYGTLATYMQALCMQEQAQQAQRRAGDEPSNFPLDAWRESASWWDTFLQDYPGSSLMAAARCGQACAQDALGNRDRARAILEDSSGLGATDRATHQFLARRLQTKNAH